TIIAPPPMPSGGVPEMVEDIFGWGADAWAVGTRGSLFRHLAGSWVEPTSQRPDLILGLWAAGGAAYAVGTGGTVLYSSGNGFAAGGLGGDQRTVNGVWGAAKNDAWAAGDAGLMVHLVGGTGTAVAAGTTQGLNGIGGSAADDIWAVGAGGTIVHFAGA